MLFLTEMPHEPIEAITTHNGKLENKKTIKKKYAKHRVSCELLPTSIR